MGLGQVPRRGAANERRQPQRRAQLELALADPPPQQRLGPPDALDDGVLVDAEPARRPHKR